MLDFLKEQFYNQFISSGEYGFMVNMANGLISGQEEFFNLISSSDTWSLPCIKRAYEYAEVMHHNQSRKSGEPYIIHPLNVAYTVALMSADTNTVCAALLHDVLEDTKATKKELFALFGEDVTNLVDGVTNFEDMDFTSKEAEDMANYRKIIRGINKDVRIIIIKFADRLHNMRTLEYTSEEKRIPKARETITYYAPLAYYLGFHDIKDELEDLCLKYLYPEKYAVINDCRNQIMSESSTMMGEMIEKINDILQRQNIPNEIIIRIKHIYGIYKDIKMGHNLYDIHDLLALKILVREVEDCYRTLGLVHREYKPVNEKFKDFIANPKTNMYRSLHTTVFAPNERLLQCRIKTYDMDYIDRHGILSYWHQQKSKAAMCPNTLVQTFPFLKNIEEMDQIYEADSEFMSHIRDEIFGQSVYVYLRSGRILQLPKGATPVDAAYFVSPEIGDRAIHALVNENLVPFSYVLQNNDRIQFELAKSEIMPRHDGWESLAKTTRARILIEKRKAKT